MCTEFSLVLTNSFIYNEPPSFTRLLGIKFEARPSSECPVFYLFLRQHLLLWFHKVDDSFCYELCLKASDQKRNRRIDFISGQVIARDQMRLGSLAGD